MALISPSLVKNEIKNLRRRGATVHGEPEKRAAVGQLGWLLGKHSECSVAELIGDRIGYMNIELEPPISEDKGDVDVSADADQKYLIQVKAPNFFELKKFGNNINEDINKLVYEFLSGSSKNVFGHVKFADSPSSDAWPVTTDSASAAYCEFELSYFGVETFRRKIKNYLSNAASSLRNIDETGCRIVALDMRYFPVCGDYTASRIISNQIQNEKFEHIDCVLILCNDMFSGPVKHQSESRLVPIENPNSSQSVKKEVFADLPLQLYRARLFSLPLIIDTESGWNTVVEIEEGVLKVEGVPIARIQ